MKKIPTVIETYTEGSVTPKREAHDQPYVYEVVEGEKVNVQLWVKYPSYDFIFGTPDKTNPNYKKEYGFFQFRKGEKGSQKGFMLYLDQSELMEMYDGFTRALNASHVERQQEWAEHNAKKDI